MRYNYDHTIWIATSILGHTLTPNFRDDLHSAQRIEAVHSAVAVWCSKSMLLVGLFDELEKHEILRIMRSSSKAHGDKFKLMSRLGRTWPPIANLAPLLTPYAYEMLRAQAAEMLQYTATESDEAGVFLVRRQPAQPPVGPPPVGPPPPICDDNFT